MSQPATKKQRVESAAEQQQDKKANLLSKSTPSIQQSAKRDPNKVKTWLKSLGLEQYADVLNKNGFDSVNTIALAEERHLEKVGVKLGHALRMLKAAQRPRDNPSAASRRDSADSASTAATAHSSSSSSSSSAAAPASAEVKGSTASAAPRTAEQEFALGVKYECGDGVTRDMKQAFDHYQRAMQLGSPDAKVKVAYFLLHGFNAVKIDYQRAFALLTEAREPKAAGVSYWLAMCFRAGKGCVADQSFESQLLKSDPGHLFIQVDRLAESSSAPTPPPDCITQLQQLAAKDDAHALLLLAVCYADGKGVGRDFNKTSDLLLRAAELGHASAQVYLGTSLVNKQDKFGAQWCEKAAEQGSPRAAFLYANYCLDGQIVEQSDSLYRHWLRVAANGGYREAQRKLGQLHFTGEHGVDKDVRAAVCWLKSAAALGDEAAGTLLKNVKKSLHVTVSWWDETSIQS